MTDRYMLIPACAAAGLPVPIAEYRFAPPRRWRFDYAWPAKRMAVEVEGGVWTQGRHNRGKGFLSDMDKYNEAVILGWRILRVTPQQMPVTAVDLVKRAMEIDHAKNNQ